jgi:HAD superfamily hydrolase (TIGR01490 family)
MILATNAATLRSTKIGAFFDIDGTLLPAPSLEWRFAGSLLARDEIRGASIIRWLALGATTLLRDPCAALASNKRYLEHLRECVVADWENSLAAVSPAADSFSLFTEGIERISWHLAQRHRVFLVSGTLGPLARAVAKRFRGAVGVCATELEVRDGRWTGRLAGEHVSGAAKTRAIRNLARKYDLYLACSYAYGDRLADAPMLEAVGHPVAVNPSKRLSRLANDRKWQVCRWNLSQPAPSSASGQLVPAKGAQ